MIALFDVMDTVAALHPGFVQKAETYGRMPDSDRETALAEARRRNEASPELSRAIDTLLAIPTYQIYFRRFPNVTPELFRDILLDLPCRRRDAPGGVGVFTARGPSTG